MNPESKTEENNINVYDRLLSSPKNIFILYLIVSGNFLANLFGCKTQQALTNNMWLKHMLGFMTIYFFVVLADSNSSFTDSPHTQLLFAIFCYVIFVLSTRMDYKWWVGFILILSVYYILQVYKDHEKSNENEKKIYNHIQNGLTYTAVLVLLLGFIIYLGKKKEEYKNTFNWWTFLVGKPKCAFGKKDVKMSDFDAFKNAFT